MARPPKYSPDVQAAALKALAENNGDLAETAEQVGIPRKTIEYWALKKKSATVAETPAITPPPVAIKKAETSGLKLDTLCEDVARRAMSRITDEKLDKMNATGLMTTTGIAIDKMRLLRDQSTANVDVKAQAEVVHGFEKLRRLPPEEILRRYSQALEQPPAE